MATIKDPDELVPCPFDPVHMVRRKRMQYHIMKCSKNMDMTKFRKCPFNAQHIVPVEEYREHVRNCEGRAVLEKEMIHAKNMANPDMMMNQGSLQVPPSNFVVPETTECWDDDNYQVVIAKSTGGGGASNHTAVIQPTSQPAPQVQDVVKDRTKPRLPLSVQTEETEIFEGSLQTDTSPPKPTTTRPLGRGRGRGRGLLLLPPSVTDSHPPVGGMNRATPPTTSEEPSINEEPSVDPKEEARKKKVRKLKKMLRQIEQLEQKVASELNEEQRAKLSRRPDVLMQLRLLDPDNNHCI